MDCSSGLIQIYIKWFTFRLGHLNQDRFKQRQEKTAVQRKTLFFFVSEFKIKFKNGLVAQLDTILIICRVQNQIGNADNDGATHALRRSSSISSRNGMDRVATIYVKHDGHTKNT